MDVSDKAPLYWHAPSADDLLSTARDVLASSIDRPLNDAANAGTAVPPSAYNIARSYRASLPGVVLSNYDTKFNPTYHSRLDDARNVTSTAPLCSIATAVARSILAAVVAPTTEPHANTLPQNVRDVVASLAANCTLSDELWQCLVRDALCPLLQIGRASCRERV